MDGPPPSDLERRRLAIVRALRGDAGGPARRAAVAAALAAERRTPLSTAPADGFGDERGGVERLERDVAEVRRHLGDVSDRMHRPGRETGPPAAGPATAAAASREALWSDIERLIHPEPVQSELPLYPAAPPGGEAAADGVTDVPPVPPVERQGPMRDRAARALFGY